MTARTTRRVVPHLFWFQAHRDLMITRPLRANPAGVEGSMRRFSPIVPRLNETNTNKTKDFDLRQADSVVYPFATVLDVRITSSQE